MAERKQDFTVNLCEICGCVPWAHSRANNVGGRAIKLCKGCYIEAEELARLFKPKKGKGKNK